MIGAFKHIAVGVLATLLLLAVKLVFERSAFGHDVEIRTYEFLQGILPSLTDSSLPIVVVDISKVPGGKDQPTSRAQLQTLLAAIASQRPRAIGIDVDFSPNETGWITPNDPAFFDSCLDLKARRHIPIFLGVYRTIAEKPNTWLGQEKYRELAAAGVARGDDTSRMPRWIQTSDSPFPLPTLGQALAIAYRDHLPAPSGWISWALEKSDTWLPQGDTGSLRTADVLVNYSKLSQLEKEHLTFSRAETVEDVGERLRGKLVLLGDVSETLDTHTVPGRTGTVPGVYLMASVAYTLAFEPLYEFTHLARFILDVVISIAIVVGAYRISVGNKSSAQARKRRGHFVVGAIVVVILAGVALVRFAGILWLDFFLVLSAVAIHPRVEDKLSLWMKSRKKGAT